MTNGLSQHWTLDEEKLAAFVLQKIDQKEMPFLSAHLEKCSECRKRVQEEREILTGIQRYGRSEMKRKLKLRLRRDQRKRFEWINVASLAAAIVIMLGGVFAIRWFIDFKPGKTKVQEIILTEQKETEPGERSLWIIGKVIEVKEQFEPRKDVSLAEEISPEVKVHKDILLSETDSRGKKESEKKDTSAKATSSGYMASIDQEVRKKGQENTLASAPVPSELQKESKAISEDKAKTRVGFDSLAKGRLEPTASKEYPVSIAETKPEQQKIIIKERKSGFTARQRHPVKNVIVRRGDIKDLPASMSSGDVTVIHTRMERTSQGILLTFYSNSIKDTIATNVEAITQDSIIVSFRNRQIGYYIPGGLAGKM
jgi:hypothetical protein